MYVCGITPYDATHLGHAATYLAFDLVNRVWRDNGHDVHYVQNVTDIDDPLLERAAATGEPWTDLATREIDLFRADMAGLRVLPPAQYVGAVEAIPEIAEAIGRLQDAGTPTASTTTSTSRWPPRRTSAASPPTTARRCSSCSPSAAATRNAPASATRSTRCCGAPSARANRPGRRRWVPGRPGWHIECSVIALNRLGMGFDVQGGGSDLIFPHHEHSAAHAEVLTGEAPFARHYVHAGMIGLDGEKMSKSRGNLVLVSKLRTAGVDPMAVRLALLDGHYRAYREWTGGRLPAAEARLARWRAAVALPTAPAADGVLAGVRAALSDDLDTTAAIAAVDTWVDDTLSNAEAPAAGDPAAPRLVRDTVDALLGVSL